VPRRPALHALAERAGILLEYEPAGGGRARVADATAEALLAALGHDASDEATARRSLARLEEREAEGRSEGTAQVGSRSGARGGSRPGASGSGRRSPLACPGVHEIVGRRRVFGLWANLWSLRGGPWDVGHGHLGHLRELVRMAADSGAAFVGLNPLHVLRRGDASPYSPTSRLFRHPLYLDLGGVPRRLRDAPGVRAALAAPRFRRGVAARSASEEVDPAASGALLEPVLHPLHDAARADPTSERRLGAYRRRGGELLRDFATFCALEEHLAAAGQPRDWRRWPRELRHPQAEGVRRFRARHARAVDRHVWVQHELERQLGAAAAAARRGGLAIGLYQDLALGSIASGFDAWAFPEVFLADVSLGAPPDAYAAEGQDWGLPPAHPERLLASGYFAHLLDAVLAHAGALRIDHVMGLFRQWWVPRGFSARDGAYVRFPAEALLDVLAERSRAHGALVVGEDLGTVPRGLPTGLADRRILSSRVMLFERDRRGAFRPARRYSPRALVTANTHDLPPLRSWWTGRDLEIRAGLGLLPEGLDAARRGRGEERRALCRRLVAEGCLPARVERGAGPEPGDTAECEPAYPELARAVHAFLARTPAPLVGIGLDDLAGETEPVNVPGVSQERHPSWTRRLGRPVRALAEAPEVARILRGVGRRARR